MHAGEHLVLLNSDRIGAQLAGRLHRDEGENLEHVRDDHVAVCAGALIEVGTGLDSQCLGHVDLHVIDEVAVPDRLEQSVGETEGQDVECRLFAQEVVDAKDLLLVEDLVQVRVEGN